MLQAIDLYITEQWFVANKLMVYMVKINGLLIDYKMQLTFFHHRYA